MSPPRLRRPKKAASASTTKFQEYRKAPKEKVAYIGFDPSLRNFGVVVLDDKGKVLENFTTVNKAPKKNEPRTRSADYLKAIHPAVAMVQNYVQFHQYRVIVAREDYAFAASSASDATLKELGGILYWEMSKIHGVELQYIPIQSAKKWACGNGNATKDMVVEGVKKNFGFDAGTEHEADAYAIASLALALQRPGVYPKKTEKQKEALVGLKGHALTTPVDSAS